MSTSRTRLLVAAVSAAFVALAPAATASAATGTAGSTAVVTGTFAATAAGSPAVAAKTPTLFSCWANPLSAHKKGSKPVQMPQHCVEGQVAGANGVQTVGGVRVEASDPTGSTARTGTFAAESAMAKHTQGAMADAQASSARLMAGKTLFEIGQMTSNSAISCTYDAKTGRYSFKATSSVRSVKINHHRVALHNGEMRIPTADGTLVINGTEMTPTGIVQTAAVLDTKGAKVVIGQSAVAIADTLGNPCHP